MELRAEGGPGGFASNYEFERGYHSKTPGYEFYGELMKAPAVQPPPPSAADEDHRFGTPEYHIDWITDLVKMLGVDQIVIQFSLVGRRLPVGQVEKSLRLFADKVLPAIHELKVSE
jgi:hypothetical protein